MRHDRLRWPPLAVLVWCLLAATTVGVEESPLDDSLLGYQVCASEAPLEGESVDDALRFSPSELSLGVRQLGVPHTRRITLLNTSNRTVRLTSVSGDTLHFHTSFFETEVLPPNGNTSFDIVFLGRAEGVADGDLFVRTSEGVRRFAMSATSVPSEYRLPPVIKLKLPYNATYAPLIYMHNPHDYPLQITEVHSSGEHIVLELPDGGDDGPRTLWSLPPHSTRPIVAVRYDPAPEQASEDEHELPPDPTTGYVRIKFHGVPSTLKTVLIVAVEIFAASETGPYAAPQFIDFGLGGTKDPPKKVRLFMGNSSPRPIRISSINVETENGLPLGGLRVLTTAKTLLPPFSPPDIHVATLSLNWKQVYDSAQCCGKIVITTKQNHRIELPFSSQALDGGLIMVDDTATSYLTSESGITTIRQVLLKNTFSVGLFVTDLIIGKGMEKHFEVSGFYPQEFKVNTVQHGFRIQLKSWTKSLKFESKITLLTNISSQIIPVYIYNGQLDVLMSLTPRLTNKGTLDFGLVGVSSTTRATIVLYNSNPVPVCLRGCGSDILSAAIQLLGCSTQSPILFVDGTEHASNLSTCNCVPAKWCAVYSVSVVAPASATTLLGELWMATVHERLIVPVTLTAVNGGRLSQPDMLTFEDCFPGTICSLMLQIKSTFSISMEIISVESVPLDKRLYFTTEYNTSYATDSDVMTSTIMASATNKVGWINYDPFLYCEGKCYTGVDANTTAGNQWLAYIALPPDTLDTDVRLLNTRYYLYKNLTFQSSVTNISLRVDTTQVRNHIIPVRIPFVWPKVYTGPPTITAPLSQVDRPSYLHFHVENPSRSKSLLIQLVFDWMLVGIEKTKEMPERLRPLDCLNDEWCTEVPEPTFYFSQASAINSSCLLFGLKNVNGCNDPDCDGPEKNHPVPDWLPPHMFPHSDSCFFMLPPNGRQNISVTFLTHYSRRVSNLLFIRNNLTAVEVVRLKGESVVASLKFGNRKQGSNSPLLFDMTEKHLKDCDRDKSKKSPSTPPNFTVKRTLVAKNTGVIPVKVFNFYINDVPCEGYGFRVLNCEPFELPPNGTYKMDIAFTPDFTLTKVQRYLILDTSLNEYINFTLISSIPVSLAAKCASVLRRPFWESSLYSVSVTILICMGLCVLFIGFYESCRILSALSASLLCDSSVQAPFDLRTVGQTGAIRKIETWECCPSPLEYKPKENAKLSSWSPEDLFKNSDSKVQKSEEQIPNKKKKIGKKNSSSPDSGINLVDCDAPTKDSKVTKANSEKSSWKNMFNRSPILATKNPKYETLNGFANLNESQKQTGDVLKEHSNEKHLKASEVSKKPTTYANNVISSDNSGQQIKLTNGNKKNLKLKVIQIQSDICEEDSSSTTTDSSNNDDADKENEISTSSSSNKSSLGTSCKKSSLALNNKKNKCLVQCRDNYEGDGEDEEYDHKSQSSHSSSQNEINQRWIKNRENCNSLIIKTNLESDKNIELNKNSTHNSFENLNPTKPSRKESSKTNPKREKQQASKKRSSDKCSSLNKAESNNVSGGFNVVRSTTVTPPAVTTLWENRASFSDVVSRSDNSYLNNYIGRPKESQEIKKPEQKSVTHTTTVRTDVNAQMSHNHVNSKFATEEPRKVDINNVKTNHSPLGPIGSNCYTKKPIGHWNDSNIDTLSRQYNISSQPSMSQQTNLTESIGNGGSSFFLSSNPYFSHFPEAKNNVEIPAQQNINSFGSIGSSYSPLSGMHASSHYVPSPGSAVQGMNPNRCDNPIGMQNPLSHYEPTQNGTNNGYKVTSSAMMNGTIPELSNSSNLLNINMGIPMMGLDGNSVSSMDPFDVHDSAWSSMGGDEFNLMGGANHVGNCDNMFEMDYNARSYYNDNVGWNSSSNMWNTPLGPTSTCSSQNNHMMMNDSMVSTNTVSSSDCGAAEWLWGYSSGNNGGLTDTAMTNNTQSSDMHSSTQSSHFMNQPQYQQQSPVQDNDQPTADNYRSLSSIWSTSSPMDLWTNPNYVRANQDLNGHNHNHHHHHHAPPHY